MLVALLYMKKNPFASSMQCSKSPIYARCVYVPYKLEDASTERVEVKQSQMLIGRKQN